MFLKSDVIFFKSNFSLRQAQCELFVVFKK